MSCNLIKKITHKCEYNAGGISNIFLLDIDHFKSYRFKGDKLYSECFVEAVDASADYVELDVVNECAFSESQSNGIYKQELATFIRSLEGEKLSQLLLAGANRYLVCFKTLQGRAFTFGSDGGASLSFGQKVGAVGEVEGYAITLSKNSIYPLFEMQLDDNDAIGWVLETAIWNDKGIWLDNGRWND